MAEQTKATMTNEFAGFLRPDQAQPIFDEAMKTSVVQSLARQIPVGVNGVEIPVTTGKPEAGWVAEAGLKPCNQVRYPPDYASIAVSDTPTLYESIRQNGSRCSD